MFVGRFLAYIFLCLSFLVLGTEGLRLLEGDADGWISIAQMINLIPFEDAIRIGTVAQGDIGEKIIEPLLHFSALFACLILSSVLFFLSRPRFR